MTLYTEHYVLKIKCRYKSSPVLVKFFKRFGRVLFVKVLKAGSSGDICLLIFQQWAGRWEMGVNVRAKID